MLKSCVLLLLVLAGTGVARAADRDVPPLVFTAPGGDAVVPAADIDQPMVPLQTDIDWPSQDLYRRGQGGTVVLRLVIDDAGVPARVAIESSSGVEVLDRSAAQAALSWRFSPAQHQGHAVASQARQPVVFDIPPEYALTRTTGRARDAWFEQRRSGAAPRPQADAQGQLPGYIADPFPIGVESIAQARQMLEQHGHALAADATPVVGYVLRDEEGYSEWAIMPALPGGVTLLVRKRLVGDAQSSWVVQSLLCEGDEQACAQMRDGLVRGAPAQSPGGPYPIPPGAKTPGSMR